MLVAEQAETAFEAAVRTLQGAGLDSRWYSLPATDAYSPITGGTAAPVYVVESRLGESHVPGYDTYATAQVFWPEYPSLVLLMIIDRHREDGSIGQHAPELNLPKDRLYTRTFLLTMHTAFNALSPHNKGVLVQIYQASISLGDLIQASVMTFQVLWRFKKDGQLASISVDFEDPLIRFIARISDPVAKAIIGDVHQFPRRETPSQLRIPFDDGQGSTYLYERSSTALDEGLRLAQSYLDRQ